MIASTLFGTPLRQTRTSLKMIGSMWSIILTTLCNAMKKQSELIEKKQLKNVYVKFPAILMARKDGEENYSVVQDFSNFSVSRLPLLVGE